MAAVLATRCVPPSGINLARQTPGDENNTCCLAARRAAAKMVCGPGHRASPPHQHQPGALQVLGVPVEAVSCKVHTYVTLLYGQEEKSTVLQYEMEESSENCRKGRCLAF